MKKRTFTQTEEAYMPPHTFVFHLRTHNALLSGSAVKPEEYEIDTEEFDW